MKIFEIIKKGMIKQETNPEILCKPSEKNISEEEKINFSNELSEAMKVKQYEYRFPTLDLLDRPAIIPDNQLRELYRKAEQLIFILDKFGVRAKPTRVIQGPAVTRYEIQPSTNTKLSKIVGLADDIALNLGVSSVFVGIIPDKEGVVAIEIPNSTVFTVTIGEILGSSEFGDAKSKLTVCLGKDIGRNVVVGDIAKWPHALIAGATGSGKSVCINTIITSILYKASPDEVKLIMVDPKQVELGVYNGIPHLLIPVVTEAKKAVGTLNWIVLEMMHRYELLKKAGKKTIDEFNELAESTGGAKLSQIVIIIDEFSELMVIAAKEVEDYICRILQFARPVGIYLILATSRPQNDVITNHIRTNIPTRIAFHLSSHTYSRMVINQSGAEKLLGNGDMLYFQAGARGAKRIQGAFTSDDEIKRIIEYIKGDSLLSHYNEDIEEHIERHILNENGIVTDEMNEIDVLLPDAIQLAVEIGKISPSMVQRRLSVGYSRAGRIIDQMEARGIISPANGSKPRDVLISNEDMQANIEICKKEYCSKPTPSTYTINYSAELYEQKEVPTEINKHSSVEKSQNKNMISLNHLLAELNSLTGLQSVKQEVNSIINLIKIRKLRQEKGLKLPDMSNHLVFMGNPGTGKTTVARLLAQIYKELGVLSQGHLTEVERSDLVAGYVGQTAIKTREVIEKAKGGILFIDEAYTLVGKSDNDYGHEAVDTLLKNMEDSRADLIVIVAGYTDRMEEFLSMNPGLRSRFNKFIIFDDYSSEELYSIFMGMCKQYDYTLTDEADAYVKEYLNKTVASKPVNFANGRFVRNYFEKIIENQANRIALSDMSNDSELQLIRIEDLPQ